MVPNIMLYSYIHCLCVFVSFYPLLFLSLPVNSRGGYPIDPAPEDTQACSSDAHGAAACYREAKYNSPDFASVLPMARNWGEKEEDQGRAAGARRN